MNKKIVITFKNGKIKAVGNVDERHLNLAASKLRVGEIEITRAYKLKRLFKRLKVSLRKKANCKHLSNKKFISIERGV